MNAWSRHDGLLQNVVNSYANLAFAQAQLQHDLAALAGDPLPTRSPNPSLSDLADERRWVAHEVAAAAHLSVRAAEDQIAVACALVDQLPATLKHLEAGQISLRHARAAVDALSEIPGEKVAELEQRVLTDVEGCTPAAFARRLERAIHELAPTVQQDRHEREVDERGVWVRGTKNGTLNLFARGLDPLGGTALMNHLNGLSEAMAAEDKAAADADSAPMFRTADQRRADALISLAYPGGDASAHPPVAINVSIALSTLIGCDEQPGDIDAPGFTPATPITATQARLLAYDTNSTWRRLITDPLGQLIDYGRTTYRPPTALADHIRARDRTCVFPGCGRSANNCDLDHHQDWAHNGHTNHTNLGTLCRRDHRAKHQTGWTITRHNNGTTQWTSPTGRTYTRPPATYPIDHTTKAIIEDPDPDPPPF